ncbi:poly(ADP-ribose) glycohydrolase-like [Pararge aegeria]|nr:poly(ADP-ribose) glycohydrolase-like [Pararge aegeria]XP_039751601.1 poly(ADP-ribose) glycohydrolase-like [Pararge aegeria]XP_039751602.1 poly(ADP-ribose) glycohydrolase-like [Pararge aegeria]
MSVKAEQEFSTAMFGSQTVWLCPDFPAVEAADNHAVLYEIPGNGATWPYKPTVGDDKWDSDHVKMPCSDHNLYNIGDEAANVGKKWDLIVEALSKPMRNSQGILEAVLTYQPGFKGIWTFTALHTFFNEYWDVSESKKFFEETLPEVRKLALALPELIQSPIPMLKREQNKSVSFTQLQLASLLANAFFCTFPERNNKTRKSEYKTYPPANFNLLYDGGGSKVMEKLKCICHYFTRVCKEQPKGVVTFSRRHIPVVECPDWSNSSLSISKVPFFVDAETFIEDAQGCIQVDFASKYIGVGVLHRGAVQEEIRFVSNPELIVSMLFTEVMGPTETVMIKGSERFSTHSGYDMTFKWAGDYRDETPRDPSNRRRCAILVMDARWFPQPYEQYSKRMFDRELNKAYVGFSFYSSKEGINYPGVATGNWGCGASGGHARLKSLLQLMACVEASRPMCYYTFGDNELKGDILKVYSSLLDHNVTVGDLYKYLLEFCESEALIADFYGYLEEIMSKR